MCYIKVALVKNTKSVLVHNVGIISFFKVILRSFFDELGMVNINSDITRLNYSL